MGEYIYEKSFNIFYVSLLTNIVAITLIDQKHTYILELYTPVR